MKKIITSFILFNIMFGMAFPTIYATEDILTNEVQEEMVEEVIETKNIQKGEKEDNKQEINENNGIEEKEENEISHKAEQINVPGVTVMEKVSSGVQDYTGLMYIDTPIYHSVYSIPDTKIVNLSGWAVSDDTDTVIKLYVNNAYWNTIERTIDRPDVNRVYPQYATTTKKAGYSFGVNVSAFPEGNHVIRVDQVSANGKVISSASVVISVKQKQYTGEMFIETPINQSNYHIPDVKTVNLSGWAISDDTNAELKLYVNNAYWNNIERTIDRPDVNRVYPQYANTTKKAGYSFGVNISAFPEGNHIIRVDQVSRYGKVISSASVIIRASQKQYTGLMYIDTPTYHSSYIKPDTKTVDLSGWAVSDDTNTVVKLYVNNVYWTNIARSIDRPDVNRACPQYANTTKKAGYSFGVNISAFPEGNHIIRVDQVSRYGKIISSASTIIHVTTPDYPGLICVDNPIQNKRYASGALVVSGWAVTTGKNDYVSIYLDGVYQTGAERRSRTDVVSIYGTQFGLTSGDKPGFYSEISTANLGEGIHTLSIVDYSEYGKKIREAEIKFMISNTLTWGIDVSHHNGSINWDAVRNSGVNFAILKIGEYRESSGRILVDDHFEEYYAACKARGIAVGGYFYSYAFDSAEAAHEADACTAIIAGKSFEMPIFFDIEDHIVTDAVDSGRTNAENLTNATITFCDIMNARGYQAGVYSYRNFFYQYLNMSVLERYNVWLAHYVTETDYTGKYDMWQYTSTGSLSGISGNVDLNWCFRRYY